MASALADIALKAAANATVEVAGPEALSIADLVGRFLSASRDTQRAVADPVAR